MGSSRSKKLRFWHKIREGVRGVAGVALATPFLLFYMPSPNGLLIIRSSGLLAIWSSGHLIIWPAGHLAFWSSRLLAIWSSGHPVIWPSSHPTIRLSGHPTILRSSGHPTICSSGLLSRCLKNVLIGIFLAYLIVGYTNLKFLTSTLQNFNLWPRICWLNLSLSKTKLAFL